jgi:APA family basic amino acid/polyamine antiporter
MGARAIVLPLTSRPGSTVFSKTIETVLAERPCRVIIQVDPSTRRTGAVAPLPAA